MHAERDIVLPIPSVCPYDAGIVLYLNECTYRDIFDILVGALL